MEFFGWLIAIGALLIIVHATSHLVARLPLSPAILYFVVGLILGPWGFDWLHFDPALHAVTMERICELAVLVSLFACGSNVGTTLRSGHWAVPVRLASIGMLLTIAALALFAYAALDFSVGAAILLAAALAPTDPVLAGDVQVADAHDRDRLRFGLTGEAGLNDGAAFPFVMLGLGLLSLHELGAGGWRWWGLDVAWAVGAGLAVGAALGALLGQWVKRSVRRGTHDAGPDAFLGLGLVAVAYGVAVAVNAYGFLAVFAAAVALQWTVSGANAASAAAKSAEATPIGPTQRFTSDLESLFEFGVVIVIGSMFATVRVPVEALAVALVLFLVVRPAAVYVALLGTPLQREQRRLAAWFGVRGIGSMYYAFFALNHGWSGVDADRMLGIVVGVVTASIFLHGISVTPLMSAYGRHSRALRSRRQRKPTENEVLR